MSQIHPKVPLDWEDIGDPYCVTFKNGVLRTHDRPSNICGCNTLDLFYGYDDVEDQTIINPRFNRSIKDSQ